MQNSTVKKLKYYIYEPQQRQLSKTKSIQSAYGPTRCATDRLHEIPRPYWIAWSELCDFGPAMTTENGQRSAAFLWCALRTSDPLRDHHPGLAQETKRNEIREAFIKIEYKCEELFRQASPIRHAGHQDAWLLCASG